MGNDRLANVTSSLWGSCPARWLPPAGLAALLDREPRAAARLDPSRLPAQLAGSLVGRRLDARLARRVYRAAGPEALESALLEVGESRTGCLEAILSRARVAPRVQARLVRRRLHPDVARALLRSGLDASAAAPLLERSGAHLDEDDVAAVVELHWEALAAGALVAGLEACAGRHLGLASWVCQQRDDVRALVLGDPAAAPGCTVAVAACHLPPGEQAELAGRLAGAADAAWALRAAAVLLDRPTTAPEVRESVWGALVAHHRAATLASVGVVAPDTWPHVDDLAGCAPGLAGQLLARGSTGLPPGGRLLQWLELADGPLGEHHAALAAHRLHQAAYGTRGVGWLAEAVAGAVPAVHDAAVMISNRCRRELHDLRRAGELASGVEGVALLRRDPDRDPGPPRCWPGLRVAELDVRGPRARHDDVVSHLAARLGGRSEHWDLAWVLAPRFTGTCDELCDAVVASCGEPTRGR